MTKFEKGDLVISTDLRWEGATGVIVNASVTSNWYEVRFFNENDAFNFDYPDLKTKHRLIVHADRLKKLPPLKFGDMVFVHDGATLETGEKDAKWTESMEKYVGTFATITKVDHFDDGFPYYQLAGINYVWDMRICEPSDFVIHYNVGDSVKIVAKSSYDEGIVTGFSSHKMPTPYRIGFEDGSMAWFANSNLRFGQSTPIEKAKQLAPIKITVDGDDTIKATQSRTFIDARAICSKDDDFDFRFGSQLALNRLIDKVYPQTAHFFGFETALLYIKSGAKVRRAKWAAGIYINAKIIEQNEIYVTTEDMFATDWRVMEDFEL